MRTYETKSHWRHTAELITRLIIIGVQIYQVFNLGIWWNFILTSIFIAMPGLPIVLVVAFVVLTKWKAICRLARSILELGEFIACWINFGGGRDDH